MTETTPTNEDAGYKPDDRSMLGPSPWKPDDPRLIAWEKAHGHDVRLDCDITGCPIEMRAALASEYQRGREPLIAALEGLLPFVKVGSGPLGDDPAAKAMRAAFDAIAERGPTQSEATLEHREDARP